MKRIVDLSHPISGGMPVFPGDPQVEFARVHTIGECGYNVTRVTMGTHTGTHVDVPSHVMCAGRGTDTVPLEALVGWAEVLDMGELAPGAEITAAHLDVFADRVGQGARLLLKTQWSRRFGGADFYTRFPGMSEGAAMWLRSRGTRLLGIEQPSVHATDHLQVHKLLLAAGIVVVESMANLSEVSAERVYLVVLPLKLERLDGAPVRAIAIHDEESPEPGQPVDVPAVTVTPERRAPSFVLDRKGHNIDDPHPHLAGHPHPEGG